MLKKLVFFSFSFLNINIVFINLGLLGVIWSFFWFMLVTDSPEDHPKITEKELDYILSSLKADKTSKKVPLGSSLFINNVVSIILNKIDFMPFTIF